MQDLLANLYAYAEGHSTLFDPSLTDVERITHLNTLSPRMLSGQLQGSFLSMISLLQKPKIILEIGTFTGYSAICLAKGLTPDGKLYTIENDAEHALLARECIAKSVYADRINLLEGDAKVIIPTLSHVYDLVFIDADKGGYSVYYDMVIDQCRAGALIIADNVLWSGKVIDDDKDKKTQLIHDFNHKVLHDDRVENVIVPIRDGINLIRKK